jgi:hypothetical protein
MTATTHYLEQLSNRIRSRNDNAAKPNQLSWFGINTMAYCRGPIDFPHWERKVSALRGRRPTASLRVSPTPQVLHVMIVLLIQTLHVLQDRHFAFPNRGSSIHCVLVECLQQTISLRGLRLKGTKRTAFALGCIRGSAAEGFFWHSSRVFQQVLAQSFPLRIAPNVRLG